jgi:hypothetical protein
MTLNEFRSVYEATPKKLVLCEFRTQQGYQINNLQELDQLLTKLKTELYLLDKQESDDIIIYDYFTIGKTKPNIIIVNHPFLTNAYWKDVPDKINDVFVTESVYRYITVDYSKTIKEYIIELPSELDTSTLEYCKSLMSKFHQKPNMTTSILFTNSDRLLNVNSPDIIVYNLYDIFTPKDSKINIRNASKQFWTELKISANGGTL